MSNWENNIREAVYQEVVNHFVSSASIDWNGTQWLVRDKFYGWTGMGDTPDAAIIKLLYVARSGDSLSLEPDCWRELLEWITSVDGKNSISDEIESRRLYLLRNGNWTGWQSQ